MSEDDASPDIEYLGSKLSPTDSNTQELSTKNIPPLTKFEELYLGELLMKNVPPTSSIKDAHHFFNQEALRIAKQNSRVQVKSIICHQQKYISPL